MELPKIKAWPPVLFLDSQFKPPTGDVWPFNKDPDVHLLQHDGNVVLIMTPIVARVVHEMVGQVNGRGYVRNMADLIWEAFENEISLDPDDYILSGSVYHDKRVGSE